MSAWRTLGHYEGVPAIPACYAIYLDDVLVYVGQGRNIRSRFSAHGIRVTLMNKWVTPWGQGRSLVFKYRPCRKYGDWAMVELRLIRRLQPSGNCVGSTRKRRQAMEAE